MLSSYKVPIGSRKMGTDTRRIWMGNGTVVGCNVMQILLSKSLVLTVQLEAIAGDSNGVDVVAILVRLNEVGLDRQSHPWRNWGKFHHRRWQRKHQDCRLR